MFLRIFLENDSQISLSLPRQESDTADRGHVAGVARDADVIVQQLRGAVESDPRRGAW